jgi:hypothetical protein
MYPAGGTQGIRDNFPIRDLPHDTLRGWLCCPGESLRPGPRVPRFWVLANDRFDRAGKDRRGLAGDTPPGC